jgi:hypothetical protein
MTIHNASGYDVSVELHAQSTTSIGMHSPGCADILVTPFTIPNGQTWHFNNPVEIASSTTYCTTGCSGTYSAIGYSAFPSGFSDINGAGAWLTGPPDFTWTSATIDYITCSPTLAGYINDSLIACYGSNSFISGGCTSSDAQWMPAAGLGAGQDVSITLH